LICGVQSIDHTLRGGDHFGAARTDLARPELDVVGDLKLTEDSIFGEVSTLTSDQGDTVSVGDRRVSCSLRTLAPSIAVISDSLGPPVNMVVALPGIGRLVLLVVERTTNLCDVGHSSGRSSHPSADTDISHRRVVQVPSDRVVTELHALDPILPVHGIALGELEISVVGPSESLELTECTKEVERLIPERIEVSLTASDNEILGVVDLLGVVAI